MTTTIKEASIWATKYLNKEVSINNISYLVQYGRIKKIEKNNSTYIDLEDLKKYYENNIITKEKSWKQKLGNDLNWKLSFENLKETDTTKHVHRLHPYKGKYIPQLVDYFINQKIDEFKKEIFFQKEDIILDPFLGSGTTMIECREKSIHSIGIDISAFNCMITNSKIEDYDLDYLTKTFNKLSLEIKEYNFSNIINDFEKELLKELNIFNNKNFPNSEFKYNLNNSNLDENKIAKVSEKSFLNIYNKLLAKYNLKLKQDNQNTFLDKWFIDSTRKEMDYIFLKIKNEKDVKIRRLLGLILSRTIRSCRATTHSDLATLKGPQFYTYYCYKHKKICKPIFSVKQMFLKYLNDSLQRIKDFHNLKSKNTFNLVINQDSRKVDIEKEIKNSEFIKIFKKKKISGIFSSPPYVGQIDYHEQHAYAYDLLGFKRKDELEIGPLFNGQGIKAKNEYVKGISDVLNNCKKYFKKDYNVFLVANDKHNLYPKIAELSGMKIVNQFKRPVLNRTEKDKNPYSEIIFHLKEK